MPFRRIGHGHARSPLNANAATPRSGNRTPRRRALISYSGEVLSKPRVIGLKRQKSGQVVDQQALIEFLTFDELRAKRTAYVQQVKSTRSPSRSWIV